jgi:hypothetical protein
MKHAFLALIAYASLFAGLCPGQQKVKEESTGKTFPAEISFKHDTSDYNLKVTGLTVRKKFVFKVYGMAHYIQDPVVGRKEDALKAVLADGKAKQITMNFARDVEAKKISEAYRDGFKDHTTPEVFKKIEPLVDQFIGYFSKDVKENEEFVLRWLPGGTVIAMLQGDEKPPITDVTFAQSLWSIWFGKDSIVDRDDLVKNLVAD